MRPLRSSVFTRKVLAWRVCLTSMVNAVGLDILPFGTLKHVDSLPNPDPSDIEALDEAPTKAKDVQIDEVAEAARPEHKRQAQEWAGIRQDPDSDLFVFVGRWSKQKGVDLIADVMPSL